MFEAVVGVALRAIVAGMLLSSLLTALVFLATRFLALTASTRHSLWTTALIATALMPFAGVGVSVYRATTAAQPAPDSRAAALPAHSKPLHEKLSFTGIAVADSRVWKATTVRPHAAALPARSLGEVLAEKLAFVRATPHMTRTAALALVGIWALGAVAGLLGLAGSLWRVRGLKRRSSPLDGALADELPWLTEIQRGREIYLRLSFETETPVAIGFRRPVILIPTELATADGLAAIEQLVLHEYAHLRRYDDWTNLVQRTIERIFWFNPVVWLVGRRIALEREIASDDAVVEKTGEPHAYATSLWRLAREMRMPEHAVVAPGALLTRKQITVRIEQLLDKKRSRLHRSRSAALGVAVASIAAVGFVATSAPAVELSAVGGPPPAPSSASAWHRDTSNAQRTTGARTVVTVNVTTKRGIVNVRSTPGAKDSTFVPVHGMSAPPNGVVANRDRSNTASGGAQQPGAGRTTAHERTVAFSVRASSPPKVTLGNGGKARGEPPQMLRDDPPVTAPPVAAPPAMPNVAAAPNGSFSRTVSVKISNLSPEQLAKLQAAAERAAAHASHVTDAAAFGPLVAKSMQEMLATLPREIAQESTSTRRSRMDGVKLSRELVASCIACSFRNADLRGLDLHGLKINADDFSGADFRGANLSGAQLVGVSLAHANLSNADLRNAELNGVELRDAILDGALLDGVKLVGVTIRQTSLRGTMLRSAISSCTGCDFSRMDLRGQDLHGLSLNGVSFADADLRNANLSGTQLVGVSLSRANLVKADLRNAQLNGTELRGAALDGALLDGIRLTGVSINRVSLRGTALRSVIGNCTGCDFGRMDLRGQDLHGISLSGANLSHADLRDANLVAVHFTGVDLSHANLSGADLTNASLSGCNLTGVELRGARTAGMTTNASALDG